MVLTALYLFYTTSRITVFKLTWPAWFYDRLLLATAVVAGLRLLIVGLLRWKTLVALGLAAIYYMVYRSVGYEFLLFLAVLTVGMIDVDYRRILKVYLFATGAAYCAAVLAGRMGLITNYVYVNPGRGFRSAWGISYPTDFASKGFFLLLMLWLACRRLPDWAMLFPCAGFIWMARYIAFSWNSTICGIAFFCVELYCILERRVIDRHPRLGWIKSGANLLGMASFPLFALAMFAMMMAYARGINIGYKLNNLLTNRLSLSVDAWREHGLTAFGTPFRQIGNGFSTITPSNYSFIDSSYPLILLRYGWVLFLALAGLWCWMARSAARRGDRRLMLALALIALHSFAEHHFIQCTYNILLVMPMAAFPTGDEEKASRKAVERAGRAGVIAHVVTAALGVAVLWLISPTVLSGIRTVLEYKGLTGSNGGWKLLFIMTGILCLAALTVWAVDRVLKAALVRDGSAKYAMPAVTLLACACIGVGGWLYADRAISAAAEDNAPLIEADREALEIAAQAATGKVYSSILPSAYQKKVEGVCCSSFFGDDLARNIGDTFLVSTQTERPVFLNSGNLYVPISDSHALYSGDRAVIEALTDAGYHATGYYSTEHEVSLAKAASLNKLKYDAGTGLRLSGKKAALKKGPYYNLYEGKYTVTFDLMLPEGEPRNGETVCTLGVTRNKGAGVLTEKEIQDTQFDEDGRLSVSIPFSIATTRNVAFSARLEKGRKIDIAGVRFVRTPDSDTHRFYDSRLRLVFEAYYDLQGQPLPSTNGYYSMEQEYDRYSNVTRQRFFDANGDPVIRKDGFAERRWDYNAKKQRVREAFFDTNGKPIMILSRQASNESVYDAAGNEIVKKYYDTDGRPVVTTMGYAEIRRQYNDQKELIREAYYGADGQPILQTYGYCAMEQDYDDAGNVIDRRWYDENGLVLRTDGYAQVHMQYNGQHQMTREEFYGVDGALLNVFKGYAADEREYDAAGNVTVYRYYDTDGNPTMIQSGYAETRREYNDRRWIVREQFFDQYGQPVLVSGYASYEREFNDYGSDTVTRHYGVSGEPVLNNDGYYEVRREYDDSNRLVEERYYDTALEPITCAKGYASFRKAYGERDEVVEESFYDVAGNPASVGAGYSRIAYEYTEDGQLWLSYYYDAQGNMVQAGSGYMHQYLNTLLDRDLTIFIAVRDDAIRSMSPALFQDLEALGVKTDLRGRNWNSFYAVITPEGTAEEVDAQRELTADGLVEGIPYSITSAGFYVGNHCSIVIDGVEYSKNWRGFNFVIFDNATKQVVDVLAFDTFQPEMNVIR